jgi:hypothetical protein
MKMKRVIFQFLLALLTTFSLQAQNYEDKINDASNFYEQKNYIESSKKYDEAFKINKPSADHLYNAACVAALLNNAPKALILMKKSIESGFFDKGWTENDTDFTKIHKTKEWQLILKAFDDKKAAIEKEFTYAFTQYGYHNLVPFREDELSGFLHKETREIVVKPIFKEIGYSLSACFYVTLSNDYQFEIDALTGKIINDIQSRRNSSEVLPPSMPDNYVVNNTSTSQIPLKNQDNSDDGFNALNGKYQRLVRLPKKENQKQQCFLFRDNENRSGLVTADGTVKFYDKFDRFENIEGTPYILAINVDIYGIIDLTTLELVLPIEFKHISNALFNVYKGCANDKNKVLIDSYFWVTKKYGSQLYMDKKGKEYIPVRR